MNFLKCVKRTQTSFKIIRNSSTSVQNTIIDPSYGLTSDQKLLQQTAYDFAVKEFRPQRREWDENEIFPVDTMRRGASLGFGGLYIPTDDGGTGLSRLESSLVFESLSMGCCSTSAYITLHNMVGWMISKYGSEETKSKYLSDLIPMKKFASYCLTEPDAGSDAASLKTTAVRKGDYYILNGSKAFISGSRPENVLAVICRTGGPGPKGISALVVDGDTEGVSFGKKEKKLGWKSHPARSITFEDAKVPASNLLGSEGFGFNIAMQGLNGARINIASCSLGAAQWAIEETLEYTSNRKQFNRRIDGFQNTQFEIASLASELFACRLALRSAASALDESYESDDGKSSGGDPGPFAASAKLLVTDKSFDIIDRCLQLFGGYGYLYDYPLGQLLRDTRIHRILGGANEIMKLVIARSLIKS